MQPSISSPWAPCSQPGRLECGSPRSKTVSRTEGYASRIQAVFLVGVVTVKTRDGLVGKVRSRPPVSSHVVFRASSDRPCGVVGMKVGCMVTGLRQAGEAEFSLENGLKPAPITHGAHQTALTYEQLVIGSVLVSAYDHGVALHINPEAMPNRCGSPG